MTVTYPKIHEWSDTDEPEIQKCSWCGSQRFYLDATAPHADGCIWDRPARSAPSSAARPLNH